MDWIVLGLHQECRRGLDRHVNRGVRLEVLLRQRQVAWIDNDSEVGTATKPVRGIDRRVEAILEVRAEGSRKVTSRGKP